ARPRARTGAGGRSLQCGRARPDRHGNPSAGTVGAHHPICTDETCRHHGGGGAGGGFSAVGAVIVHHRRSAAGGGGTVTMRAAVGWAARLSDDVTTRERACRRVAHAVEPLDLTAWAKSRGSDAQSRPLRQAILPTLQVAPLRPGGDYL